MTDWKKTIQDLSEFGLSEAKIAEHTGLGVSQQTIHRLKTGEIKEPKYGLGAALVGLHARICKNKEAEPLKQAS